MEKYTMDEAANIESPTPPSKPQPIIVKKNSNAPLVGAIIFLALVIGATALFFAMQDNTQTVITPTQLSPTPTITSPTIEPVISTAELQLITFNFEKMKDLSFPAFSIQHPKDWIAKETRNDLISTLIITKGESQITINQGPMGGNQCVFNGEMPDGPANDYRDAKYEEINTNGITLRRIIPDEKGGKQTHSFCSNSTELKTSFGIPTIFGVITYTLNAFDEKSIVEMDSIVQSIKPQ